MKDKKKVREVMEVKMRNMRMIKIKGKMSIGVKNDLIKIHVNGRNMERIVGI
jgi:hypothetical protein